jgi:hypothetical protein
MWQKAVGTTTLMSLLCGLRSVGCKSQIQTVPVTQPSSTIPRPLFSRIVIKIFGKDPWIPQTSQIHNELTELGFGDPL